MRRLVGIHCAGMRHATVDPGYEAEGDRTRV
jgi:hypothetical protein